MTGICWLRVLILCQCLKSWWGSAAMYSIGKASQQLEWHHVVIHTWRTTTGLAHTYMVPGYMIDVDCVMRGSICLPHTVPSLHWRPHTWQCWESSCDSGSSSGTLSHTAASLQGNDRIWRIHVENNGRYMWFWIIIWNSVSYCCFSARQWEVTHDAWNGSKQNKHKKTHKNYKQVIYIRSRCNAEGLYLDQTG